jgi:hypothetical protein
MHPRRLPYFVKSVRAIDYMDVVLAKNFPLLDAQKQIIKVFLEDDYDILVFTSDDTIIPYEAPKTIVNDILQTGHKIITGWSKCRPNRPEANITVKPPRNIDRNKDRPVYYNQYGFMKVGEIQSLIKQGKTMIPVWFVGWSLTGMTRGIVQQWTPAGWFFQKTEPYHYVFKGSKGCWTSSDLWYSYQMAKLGYAKYCDLKVYVPHDPPLLGKANPERAKLLLVGKEPPEVELIPAKKPRFL